MADSGLRLVEMDDTDKSKALEAALSQIERAHGKGSIMKLGEDHVVETESVSTGSWDSISLLVLGACPLVVSLKSMARNRQARQRLRSIAWRKHKRQEGIAHLLTQSMHSIPGTPRNWASK